VPFGAATVFARQALAAQLSGKRRALTLRGGQFREGVLSGDPSPSAINCGRAWPESVAAAALSSSGQGSWVAVAGALAVLVFLAAAGTSNRLSALLPPPRLERVNLPIADGVTAPAREAEALERLVPYVRARVPAGTPIFVAPRRSDLVRYENLLLYVLVDRPTLFDAGATLAAGPAATHGRGDAADAASGRRALDQPPVERTRAQPAGPADALAEPRRLPGHALPLRQGLRRLPRAHPTLETSPCRFT